MSRVTIDLQLGTPPYEQVRQQLAGLIRAGSLREGDRLPVVRVLASDLGIAPNTIARAYRELAADGLVVSRRRTGTVVRRLASDIPPEVREAFWLALGVARDRGMNDGEIEELVRGLLADLQGAHTTPS